MAALAALALEQGKVCASEKKANQIKHRWA